MLIAPTFNAEESWAGVGNPRAPNELFYYFK